MPCILVVADPGRIRELVDALAEPLDRGPLEVLESTGGDDAIELFEARRPPVVVLTATLELGDAGSLIETLRGLAPRAEVGIVLVGDDQGPIRTALDALELAPDRFLTRPLAPTALRFAVTSCLDAVELARGSGSDPPRPRTKTDRGTGVPPAAPATPVDDGPTAAQRAALRARWEALADSIGADEQASETLDEPAAAPDELGDPAPAAAADTGDPAPLPPPLVIRPRRRSHTGTREIWEPGTTSELPAPPAPLSPPEPPEPPEPPDPRDELVAPPREPTLILREEPPAPRERPSGPIPLAALMSPAATPPPLPAPPATAPTPAPTSAATPPPDFARQLREKMSMMAQRLFQASTDAGSTPTVDVAPRHDHHTEIDLALLAEEPALVPGVTEIEAHAPRAPDATTAPGATETQVRERGLPDSGEIVRGASDVATLLARMFAQGATGRVSFLRGDHEKIVFFDQGRPVFASSNEPGDRMGELLVREGKITAAQYERCQQHALSSGRRMGEILVDFGYLKRRELLPAVRRHVEDILYSLFSWDRGRYQVHLDPTPSDERIRLSRHPAALILEGIRRKLDRSTLERLVGPPSTVIEVPDRERLGGLVSTSDLASEERAALAAFDGQADLGQVGRTAGVDLADLLPLAWGLCVLGLATARRSEAEAPDEAAALVGETDLEIDRERVRARWQLVGEADYFALLGVRRDATAFEIRRAYQAARRDFAVDCFPHDLRRELAQELEEIACVLDEAFRVLRDDRLRLTYLSNLVE